MLNGNDIVEHARTWIGVKWRHQGRGLGPNREIDCAGLLIVTAQHFDLPHGDMVGYRRQPGPQFINNILKHTDKCGPDDDWHGAIGVFDDKLQPCHCGIFAVDPDTKELTVIHSEAAPKGSVHEEGYDTSTRPLKARLVAVRHFKEVHYGK